MHTCGRLIFRGFSFLRIDPVDEEIHFIEEPWNIM